MSSRSPVPTGVPIQGFFGKKEQRVVTFLLIIFDELPCAEKVSASYFRWKPTLCKLFLLEFYFSEMANAVKLSIRGSRIVGGIENREFCVYRTF